MKVAIIGTGKVGSVLALLLANNEKINELLLINRTKELANGLKMDLMGTYPKRGSNIIVGEYKDAKDSDIIFITCGVFGAPEGVSLFDINKKVIEDVFTGWKPKQSSNIVIITTPVDETALIAKELSSLPGNQILGFGGQLDVNRLEYLIRNDINDFSNDIERYFICVHGASGMPLFIEKVSDKETIIENSRSYFKKYLSGLKISTLGTSSELAKLANILMNDEEKIVDISYYNKNENLFITWPCKVNKEGVKNQIEIKLSDKEKTELKSLIDSRKPHH